MVCRSTNAPCYTPASLFIRWLIAMHTAWWHRTATPSGADCAFLCHPTLQWWPWITAMDIISNELQRCIGQLAILARHGDNTARIKVPPTLDDLPLWGAGSRRPCCTTPWCVHILLFYGILGGGRDTRGQNAVHSRPASISTPCFLISMHMRQAMTLAWGSWYLIIQNKTANSGPCNFVQRRYSFLKHLCINLTAITRCSLQRCDFHEICQWAPEQQSGVG